MPAQEADSPRRQDLLVGMRDVSMQMAERAGRVPHRRLSHKGKGDLEDLNLLITEVPRFEIEDEDLQSIREALEAVPDDTAPPPWISKIQNQTCSELLSPGTTPETQAYSGRRRTIGTTTSGKQFDIQDDWRENPRAKTAEDWTGVTMWQTTSEKSTLEIPETEIALVMLGKRLFGLFKDTSRDVLTLWTDASDRKTVLPEDVQELEYPYRVSVML